MLVGRALSRTGAAARRACRGMAADAAKPAAPAAAAAGPAAAAPVAPAPAPAAPAPIAVAPPVINLEQKPYRTHDELFESGFVGARGRPRRRALPPARTRAAT